MSSQK